LIQQDFTYLGKDADSCVICMKELGTVKAVSLRVKIQIGQLPNINLER